MPSLIRAGGQPTSVGFLMTPILVVNGAVKHHGSVATVEQIREWLVSTWKAAEK